MRVRQFKGAEACARVIAANATGIAANPNDEAECKEWRQIQEIIRESYMRRLFPQLPLLPPGPMPPPPDIGQFFGDPSPQPSVFSKNRIKDLLFAELFLDTLSRDPTPTPTVINQIRESGAQLEVVKDLIQQFEEATNILKMELNNLEKCCHGK